MTAYYGCFDSKKNAENSKHIYATVNDNSLTESELRSLVPYAFYNNLNSEYKKEIVKEWVNNELLYQEALQLGIDKEPEIAQILLSSKRDLLITEILERKLAETKIPSEEELKEYYDKHKDYFILQSNEYRVRYALFDTIEDAQDFWSRVKKGASFSELARQQSLHQSAKSDGNVGMVNEESIEPAIWRAISNTVETLGLSKISDPFSVIDGFGIVIIDEILSQGTVKPFADVKDQVNDYYMIEKREERKKSLLMKLTREAKIEYSF